MQLTRSCRWCPNTFVVLTQFSTRYHCETCWEWITKPLPGVTRSKGFTVVGKPTRFRDVEHHQERMSADAIGK